MIWSIIYITCVLLANYTATWFIPLPGSTLIATGTIIFGITFTARDYVHRLGRPYVYTMILITALMASLMILVLGTPTRIIIASVIAIILSETTDTEIYQRLLDKSWLVRVLSSNAISVPLDTLLFNMIAFALVFPLEVLAAIIIGEIVTKYIVGIIVALWRFRR